MRRHSIGMTKATPDMLFWVLPSIVYGKSMPLLNLNSIGLTPNFRLKAVQKWLW